MADELDLDLDLDEGSEINNRAEKRLKDLSEKVRITAKERDEIAQAKKELEQQKAIAEKERDFFASFSDSVGKYPNASEYKDNIKEKVLAGYTVEDATVAVLAREGKLQMTQPVIEKPSPAGGSATTGLVSEKKVHEMSREEKLAALMEAEKRGELSVQ